MPHSYESLMHFLRHGGDVQGTQYYPTNSFQLTPFDQAGRIAPVGRKFHDKDNDYNEQTLATYKAQSDALRGEHASDSPRLDLNEARDFTGNILHSSHLSVVPGMQHVLREWDPQKHIQTYSGPDQKVAGEMGYDGVMRLAGDEGIRPQVVTHEVSHLISRLGRQFTPHKKLLGTTDPAHSWVFRRAHNLVLNSVGYDPEQKNPEHQDSIRPFQEHLLRGPTQLPNNDQLDIPAGAIDLQSVLNKQNPESRSYVPRRR